MSTADLAGLVVSAEALAHILELTPIYIVELARKGVIVRDGRGDYPLAQAVRSYVNFLRSENRRPSNRASAQRLQEARAREIELRMARDERQLILTEEAIGFVDEVLGYFKAEMDGLPARVSRDLAIRRKIEQELDEQFMRSAARFEREAAALRTGSDTPETATSD